jgi:hypothetical protein
MEVECHDETLVDVVILSELRPASSEILLAVAIVSHLHLIGDATARLLTKNRFAQFAAIHELREIQRQALNFTALRHGNAKKREDTGNCSKRSGRRRGRI